jgi:hypothetical protein
MGPRPKTAGELYAFYFEKVKPLYAAVQSRNELPSEVLFEIHAAFDHLSRIHNAEFGETEENCVDKAYSHLKRSCLDIFKIFLKETIDNYNELKKLDTSILDNGEFDRSMRALIHKIQTTAQNARCIEGRYTGSRGDLRVSEAFDVWEPVFVDCVEFEKKFYLHPNLEWARKKGFRITLWQFLISLLAAALVSAFLETPLSDFMKWCWRSVAALLGLKSDF